MTPRQIELARHALGLTTSRVSYRNRFFAARGGRDDMDWRSMVNAGYALRIPWGWTGGDFYFLTEAGAKAALRRRERLDAEDFPSPASPE